MRWWIVAGFAWAGASTLFLAWSHHRLESRLVVIGLQLTQLGGLMGKTEDKLVEISAQLDAATNELASDLAALRAEIADKVSPETLAKLDANVARLVELGKDPTNPVPPA